VPVAGEKPLPRGLPPRSEWAAVVLAVVNPEHKAPSMQKAAVGVELNVPTGTLTRPPPRCVHEQKGSRALGLWHLYRTPRLLLRIRGL
jgi:hypothetical protein